MGEVNNLTTAPTLSTAGYICVTTVRRPILRNVRNATAAGDCWPLGIAAKSLEESRRVESWDRDRPFKKMVGRVGLEPTTNRLKAECSTN